MLRSTFFNVLEDVAIFSLSSLPHNSIKLESRSSSKNLMHCFLGIFNIFISFIHCAKNAKHSHLCFLTNPADQFGHNESGDDHDCKEKDEKPDVSC